MIDDAEKMRQVQLEPHNPSWSAQFQEETLSIRTILGINCDNIYHIGSTSIPNIYAKPVIDILVVVNNLSTVDVLHPAFERLGYACMGKYGIPGRRYYWKDKIQHTHHIHLFKKDHPEIARYLAFKEYMLQHPNTAQAYSWIKRCLAKQFPTDIEAYVNGKESFVRMINHQTGCAQKDQQEASDAIRLEPHHPHWIKYAAAEIEAIQKSIG